MGICGARGCGLQRAHCALAMKRYKGCGGTGRCGERIERCQWQKKRDERVAAVKIGGVRRKAARKFWAPQQDHRPLRNITRVAIVIGRRGEGTPPYGCITRGAAGRAVGDAGPYERNARDSAAIGRVEYALTPPQRRFAAACRPRAAGRNLFWEKFRRFFRQLTSRRRSSRR